MKTMKVAQPATKKEREKKKICDVCGKGFVRRRGLLIHFEVVHDPNPRTHPCQLCEKVYSRRDNLVRHLRINHSASEPSGEVFSDQPTTTVSRVLAEQPSPATPTQDEPMAISQPPPIEAVIHSVGGMGVDSVAVCGSPRIVTSPRKKRSLDSRLADLKNEWADPPEDAERLPGQMRNTSLLGFRDPPASERALALEIVGGVVRHVLSAPVGENLLSLKTKVRRIYPEFGFVTELVTQAALDARLGAQAWIRPKPVEKKPSVTK